MKLWEKHCKECRHCPSVTYDFSYVIIFPCGFMSLYFGGESSFWTLKSLEPL